MRLVIREFWNKVIPNPNKPWGTEVLPDFEQKSVVFYPNSGGHKSIESWKYEMKKIKGFREFTDDGKAVIDLPTRYQIKSYQIVSLEDEF